MSSTNKFPSGLNNWVDSDKPVRSDFVSDNQIIDQNALWKNDYDASGVVAQSGGIDSYTMAKSIYDPVGAVAEAGGITGAIQSAVSANEGYTTYIHSKTGSVHSLTNPTGSSIVRFVATADFNDGDAITVNGTSCTAKTTDGDILEGGFFATGAVVSCFLNGTTLNFKSGGAGLSYKVIAVADESLLPVSMRENTIAVITTTPIAKYTFSATQPEYAAEGDVWISTGVASPAAFNALRKNTLMVYPAGCVQYISGAWRNRLAKIFRNGNWTSTAFMIWQDGLYPSDITGAWRMTGTGGSTVKVDNGQIKIYGVASSSSWPVNNFETGKPIDVTGANIIRFNTLAGTTTNARTIAYIRTTPMPDSQNAHLNNTTAYQGFSGNCGECNFNVAGINGSYYFGLRVHTAAVSTNATGYYNNFELVR